MHCKKGLKLKESGKTVQIEVKQIGEVHAVQALSLMWSVHVNTQERMVARARPMSTLEAEAGDFPWA